MLNLLKLLTKGDALEVYGISLSVRKYTLGETSQMLYRFDFNLKFHNKVQAKAKIRFLILAKAFIFLRVWAMEQRVVQVSKSVEELLTSAHELLAAKEEEDSQQV